MCIKLETNNIMYVTVEQLKEEIEVLKEITDDISITINRVNRLTKNLKKNELEELGLHSLFDDIKERFNKFDDHYKDVVNFTIVDK